MLLGESLLKLGRRPEALHATRRAIAREGSSSSSSGGDGQRSAAAPRARYNGGVILTKMGAVEEAVAMFEAAGGLQPSYAKAHANLASLYATLSRSDEALASITTAVEQLPDVAQLTFMRAEMLGGGGRRGEATAELRRTLELEPTHAGAAAALREGGK